MAMDIAKEDIKLAEPSPMSPTMPSLPSSAKSKGTKIKRPSPKHPRTEQVPLQPSPNPNIALPSNKQDSSSQAAESLAAGTPSTGPSDNTAEGISVANSPSSTNETRAEQDKGAATAGVSLDGQAAPLPNTVEVHEDSARPGTPVDDLIRNSKHKNSIPKAKKKKPAKPTEVPSPSPTTEDVKQEM